MKRSVYTDGESSRTCNRPFLAQKPLTSNERRKYCTALQTHGRKWALIDFFTQLKQLFKLELWLRPAFAPIMSRQTVRFRSRQTLQTGDAHDKQHFDSVFWRQKAFRFATVSKSSEQIKINYERR